MDEKREKEMMKKGYLTSEENADIIEGIIKRHRKTVERVL